MDPYEILGISPDYEGDLRALRNLLVKRYFEAGETPDEERMKAIKRRLPGAQRSRATPRAAAALDRDGHAPGRARRRAVRGPTRGRGREGAVQLAGIIPGRTRTRRLRRDRR